MLFSERKGLKPIRKNIQIDSMDQVLRTALWNAWILCYGHELQKEANKHGLLAEKGCLFMGTLWMKYFKRAIDTISFNYHDIYPQIKNCFLAAEWYEVYDFIEFTVASYPDKEVNKKFIKVCNALLEKELSAYRFLRDKIMQITSEEEISAIEATLNISDRFKGPRIQIKSAFDKVSDRKSPDYRGSIKDSIGAVEGIVKIITQEPKASLGKALKKIEERSKVSLHPAFKEALIKLYGYTSSAQGIRHALLDEPNLTFADAKFMLVSCSAFINYLIDKTK